MTKGKPNADVYAWKHECLSALEKQAEHEHIDLAYGDESSVSQQPYVPRGWQFPDEKVTTLCERGGNLNCFALLTRDNRCFVRTTTQKVTADWIVEQIDDFVKTLCRLTVIVLDNASVHKKAVKDRMAGWEEQGLFVFFLPTYSPHLNIAEILWRKLKCEWLQPAHYADKEMLHDAVKRLLNEVGATLKIAFKPFHTVDLLHKSVLKLLLPLKASPLKRTYARGLL